MAPIRPAGSRVRGPLLGLAGQLLNAGTNVATAFVASYLLVPDAFGLFVLAYAVVTIALATSRGLVGSTLLACLPGVDGPRRGALASSALGFTVGAGLVATVLAALVAVGLPALAWFVPWILVALLQDACRHVFLADGRTGSACALDAAWAAVQIVVLGTWLLVAGTVTIGAVAASWGAGALAGVVAFALLCDVRPARPGPWVRTTRDVSGWFTGAAVVGQCEVYLVLLLAGTLLAPADAGGLRAVQLVALQPAIVVLGALLVLATPVFAGLPPDAGAAVRVRATTRVLLSVLPVIALIMLVVPLRMPLMELLLPQYVAFSSIVLPTALHAVTWALSVPALALLRGMRRGAAVFWLQITRVVLVVGSTLVGLFDAGVDGVAWAQVVAGMLAFAATACVAWRGRDARVGAPVPVT